MLLASQVIILKEINIPEALIKLRSDGIMHVHYKKDITIDVDSQLMMREIFREIAPERKLHYIFSASTGVSFTKEARESSTEKESPIASYAIITNNLAYRIVANFYLRVNKPKVPYRLFSVFDEAVKWCHAQVQPVN